MYTVSKLAIFGVTSVSCHSWADNVGGGNYRGAQGATDQVRQRYYCPLNDLAACQPDPKHGVTLTAQNMRPCRTDYPKSTLMGRATAGQSMYVHWAGNGHTSPGQSAGTCVHVEITPYSVDPARSAFTTLAACLPYARGDATDGTVTLPANLPAGEYTVFWWWDFAPFWYSSCSDIVVTKSGGQSSATTQAPPPVTTRTTPPVTPRPTQAPPPVTTRTTPPVTPRPTQAPAAVTPRPTQAPAAVTTRPPAPLTTSIRPPTQPSIGGSGRLDCKFQTLPNSYCRERFGASSYCQSWQRDKCGRSLCFGETYDDTKC
jgi:hypothetical protein